MCSMFPSLHRRREGGCVHCVCCCAWVFPSPSQSLRTTHLTCLCISSKTKRCDRSPWSSRSSWMSTGESCDTETCVFNHTHGGKKRHKRLKYSFKYILGLSLQYCEQGFVWRGHENNLPQSSRVRRNNFTQPLSLCLKVESSSFKFCVSSLLHRRARARTHIQIH